MALPVRPVQPERLCRILYTARTGRIASKPRAARWALRATPRRFHDVIRRALGTGGRISRGRVPLGLLRDFLGFADEVMN